MYVNARSQRCSSKYQDYDEVNVIIDDVKGRMTFGNVTCGTHGFEDFVVLSCDNEGRLLKSMFRKS